MSNSAVITTEAKEIGVYLHWNGGRDSVEAFLQYCDNKYFRPPEEDCYGWARLCQIIANFFNDNGLSIGIDLYLNLNTLYLDNGIYIIKKWKIIGRENAPIEEQNRHSLSNMLKEIQKAQLK